ncbi:hypothetical protein C0J52_09285 [Blattella germanica]|nr:hypothetical protein C0J52_09285 [Blattella germanica]
MKPLQRISIKDVDNSPVMQNTVTLQDLPSFKHTIQEQKHTKSEDRSEGPQSTAKNEKKDGITRDTSAVNRTFEPEENSKNLKPDVAFTDHIPPAPSTSVQFYVSWKKVRTNPELSYLYLKVKSKLLISIFAFQSW